MLTKISLPSPIAPVIGMLLVGALAIALAITIRKHTRFSRTKATHFGTLMALLLLGLNGIAITLIIGKVDYRSLNCALFCELVLLGAYCVLTTKDLARQPGEQVYAKPYGESILYLASWLVSLVIAVRFFTPDLVPSSMTGDPARHLLSAVHLDQAGNAIHKPIYRLLLGYLMPILGESNDQGFLAINIALYCLLNGSAILLYRPRRGVASMVIGLAAVTLVVTGYSLFALIYGYFTLIPSAAFAVSGIASLRSFEPATKRIAYWLPVATLTGTALTHALATPAAVLAFVVTCGELTRYRPFPWIRSALPGVTVILAPAIISNWLWLNPIAGEPLIVQTVLAAGFVDESVFANLWLLITMSLVLYPVAKADPDFRHLIVSSTSLALCLGAFVILRDIGMVAPYYANRLQIVVLPLLTVTVAQGLNSVTGPAQSIITLVSFVAISFQAFRFFALPQTPLALSTNEQFIFLRWSSDSIFERNWAMVANSPLQFTASDRALLKRIGRGESGCIPESAIRLPLLGSDHSAIWFELYVRMPASNVNRSDGYIESQFYVRDAEQWLSGGGESHIAIIPHINYPVPYRLIRSIRNHGELVCAGDAIEIYRRPQ